MNNKITFVDKITFDSLNPHNFHLKNDYINNLLSTAFLILPVVANEVENIRIKKGFLSKSYIRSLDTEVKPYFYKHSVGLALELTWKDWDINTALLIADTLYSESEEKYKLIINIKEKSLYIGRGFKNNSITEVNGDVERVIRI